MEAPTIIPQKENIKRIKLKEIKCIFHSNNNIVGVCNDQNCKEKSKYIWVDRIFEKHSWQVGIKSNLLEDNYLNKINKILTEEE